MYCNEVRYGKLLRIILFSELKPQFNELKYYKVLKMNKKFYIKNDLSETSVSEHQCVKDNETEQVYGM